MAFVGPCLRFSRLQLGCINAVAAPERLCVLSVCDINLCLLMHNAGCQMPEGPDYLLPVIILSLIVPLVQNVQCRSSPLSLSWMNWANWNKQRNKGDGSVHVEFQMHSRLNGLKHQLLQIPGYWLPTGLLLDHIFGLSKKKNHNNCSQMM